MLRTIFVLSITGLFVAHAFQGAIYSLLFYLWVAYFRPETWVWNDWIASLNLSYFAAILTIIAAVLSPARWRINLRVGLLGLLLLHACISTALSNHGAWAWPYWIEFLKTILIAYLIVVLTDTVPKFRLVLMAIGLSLGFEAAKQGWVSLILRPGATNTNTLPMLGDNNGVAVGILMLVPILTTLAATSPRRSEQWVFRFLAFGAVYRAISTYSRGGFLACAALGVVYLLRSNRKLAAVAGIAFAVALIVPAMPDAFWDRMQTIAMPAETDLESEEADRSVLGRLHFWQVAVDMANDRPFFGVGHNSYNVSYDAYDTSNGEFGQGRSVHSSWFGFLSELGYPGFLLYITHLLLAFGAAWKARRVARLRPEWADYKSYAFAIEGAVAAFAVGSSFVPLQYNEMFWHVIGLSIALDVLASAALREHAAAALPVIAPGSAGARPMAVAS